MPLRTKVISLRPGSTSRLSRHSSLISGVWTVLRTSSWSSRPPRSTWRSLFSYVAEPDYDGLASTLGRLHRLKVLSIHPFDRHPLPSTLRPLDLVPSLHRFYMCQNDFDSAPVRPHLNLTILKIDNDIPSTRSSCTRCAGRWSPSVGSRRTVRTGCRPCGSSRPTAFSNQST
jgi:hypothetical protein